MSSIPSPSFWSPPDVSQAAFIAPNATIIGDIVFEPGASIWYGATIRGDVEKIHIGAHTNVQDGAVIHGDHGLPTRLEHHVTIGHRAVIHSATIKAGSLIGIGGIILNGVTIGPGCIVGAGAVVTKDLPPRTLAMGVPAKPIRELSDIEIADLITHAEQYEKLALVHANRGTDLGFC
ncbi:MAG: gamma carbonic anhydrase family protein [Symploca sp. SIO2B6]|nr:gamma carbonic anhydrase family protein [Symploca sp. SIO2B6]